MQENHELEDNLKYIVHRIGFLCCKANKQMNKNRGDEERRRVVRKGGKG